MSKAIPSASVIEALAVTAELCSTQLSPGAAHLMAEDVAIYPEQQILGALSRCRRELSGRLTLAAILSRLDDGRPGPEEAWAMIPRDEYTTMVWTQEMASAAGVARELIKAGEFVSARMAFIEAYRRLVQESRDRHEQAKWNVSEGWDKAGREGPIKEAVALGRLTDERAKLFLPQPLPEIGDILKLASDSLKINR